MKKLLILLVSSLLLFTSCEVHWPNGINRGYEENHFLAEHVVSSDDKDTLTFLIFTDAHIGKSGSDYVDNSSRLVDELHNGDYDAVLNLGDTSDNGALHDKNLHTFLEDLADSRVPVISVLGNHELHSDHGKEKWSALYKDLGTLGPIGRFTFSDKLSIYALDSSLRLYGRAQLDALEEALENDGSAYKIFLTHIDTASGENVDKSLVFSLGLADIKEMDRLYGLMSRYSVGIMFSGHRHQGGGLISHGSFYEFNMDALHSDSPAWLESRGCWLVMKIDLSSGSARLEKQLAETGEVIGSWEITL